MTDWRDMVASLGVLAVAAFALMLIFSECACADPKPAVDVTTYEAEQLRCVELAETRSEADVCRAAVKRKYNRLDGGT